MCGVLGIINHNNKSVGEFANAIYEAQKHRGRDGFGFVEVLDEDVPLHTFVLEQDAIEKLKKSISSCILFHHRIPTSTTNNVKSNHPIFSDCLLYEHNYYLIHNGHINNSSELRKEHEKYGIKYNTDEGSKFTDSESLLHELALIIEGHSQPKEFTATGGLAFIMLQTDKFNNPTALYFGRNHMPLKIQRTPDAIVLRSECSSGEEVETNKLFRYDYKTKELTEKDVLFAKPSNTLLQQAKKNELVEIICDLYEHRHITYYAIERLTREELRTLLIISYRVANKQFIEYEKKLLTNISSELVILKTYYEGTMRIIDIIETKLK